MDPVGHAMVLFKSTHHMIHSLTFIFSCLKNVLQVAYVYIYKGTQWLYASANKHSNQLTA